MKIKRQKQAFCHSELGEGLSSRQQSTKAQRHNAVLRLLLFILIILHSSLSKGQNTYSLTTASCQSPCGINDPLDGWISFACHNLGADTSLDPNSYVVGNADGSGGTLGYLFQWGRPADGHQLRNSATTTTLSPTDVPGHNKFIIVSSVMPSDWRTTVNNALWGATKTANDPCPAGYKVPSATQWNYLTIAPKTFTGNGLRFNTGTDNLFLPVTGYRHPALATLENMGLIGHYWSTTLSTMIDPLGYKASFVFFTNSNQIYYGLGNGVNGEGEAVRCVPEF